MSAGIGKCAPCVDELIGGGGDETAAAGLPDAIMFGAVLQNFTMGAVDLPAPLILPVCFAHRARQLGKGPPGILAGRLLPPGFGGAPPPGLG